MKNRIKEKGKGKKKDFLTVEIPAKLHARLSLLAKQKNLAGEEKTYLYQLATQAVEDYIEKHTNMKEKI
ncbi:MULTISPECIES: hypothetical protein [Francisellaceae]|uniref:hypothetical protein n=1 Tax=Francisellaceae TaxID=34064 RepID=UPI001908A129|nr:MULTISPECIES: hypothetical protein [Francisellaceae]MBK2046064.1 hypothetical protein [Allofrancisella guangzhouensis]MBK2257587.1 hypothetical protein [Francisella philomiragia]MBK2270293.1 hypothetical protein [Francisella philomiragia]MBK2272097.1 hypothetical protein [Francisella philomiragia]MBK2275936.1 hypothetical protein [Francisella philomiragia]